MTLSATLRSATERLAAAGVPSPDHDARALAAHALGLSGPGQLALVDALDAATETSYDALVARRADRVPLQHLVGTVGFRYLELAVGPGVFVPRPETETVVQWAIDEVGERPLIVDLCTGSGAIALSLVQEVPDATVHAVEIDPDALAWARRNVQECALPVQLHEGGLEGALAELDGTVDLVISNPPYVPTGAQIRDPEVSAHDPAIALWAGEDGLDVIRQVEVAARRLLRPGGVVVVEHADLQGESAPAVFKEWAGVADHQDLTGRARFLTARRPSPVNR